VRIFLVILILLFSNYHHLSYAQEKTAITTKKASKKPSEKNATATDKKNTNKSTEKALKIPLPVNQHQQFKDDIKHFLKTENVTTLLNGSKDFITLIQEQTTSNAKGVAILLPNWQQSAVSSPALNYFRKTLPDLGWTTITVQSPEKPTNYPSKKIDPRAQADENKEVLATYQDNLSAVMNKVMEKAANYPGIFLLIAESSNAAILVNSYQQAESKQPDILVILSGHLLTEKDNQNFINSLANIDVPILDLYLGADNLYVQKIAPLSAIEAKKQLKVYYRQQKLDNFTSGNYPNEELLKAVKAWIKHLGW